MNGPKLTQTDLLDVLVAEIESFKKTKQAYSEIAQKNREHLNRLEKLWEKPLPIDIEPMQEEHTRIKATLHQGLYIPNWLAISLLCLTIAFSISAAFNYRQYIKIKDQNELIEYAKLHIEKLKKGLPKPKSKP